MFTKAVQTAMNEQIKSELYSGYLYLAMAAHFETLNLKGFAHWMRVQAQEEQTHALKFFDFIIERGGEVELKAIEQPPSAFGSPLEVFQTVLEHEKTVTGLIDDLYALAKNENDYASEIFLQWFVTEQVEEEDNATEIVETLKMIGDKAQGTLMLDRALGQRGD